MFDDMKPGHILRFGTCPSTIISPQAGHAANCNETLWTSGSDLGRVQCLSHPSGHIALIAADAAKRLRTTPSSLSRKASYSKLGRALTRSNRMVSELNCHFVGYTDGRAYYIESTETVFSKDFSGCLMVLYTYDGRRRVAHVAASQVPDYDCKQLFLDTLRRNNRYQLIGWFKPYVDDRDGDRKVEVFHAVSRYIEGNINKMTTFGVVTQAGSACSVDVFKPANIAGNDWVVTGVTQHEMRDEWNANN